PTQRGNYARSGSTLDATPMALADDRAPALVTDLRATVLSATKVRLTWTSPIDPGGWGRAVRYDVRVGGLALTEQEFFKRPIQTGVGSPRAAGQAESLLVLLPSGWPWYARMRALDASGNWSGLSNQASFRTPSYVPSPVYDLRVTAMGESTATLAWTATGGDENVGRPSYYDVRA